MAEKVDDGPNDTLSEVFWAVAAQLRRLSRETLAPLDIAPSHSRAIGVLARHGVMRLSELSDHLRIAPRSTTEVVDALEARGLAARTPDPNDRRATLVTLTEEGTRIGHEIRRARLADAERFFGTLSDDDRVQLDRILRSLRH